jgi:acyl carrier protein
VAIGVFDDEVGSEEAVILAETDALAQAHKALRREVKRRVYGALELILRKVDLVPRGWLVKTTSGKICRSEKPDSISRQNGRQGVGMNDDIAGKVGAIIAETFSVASSDITDDTVADEDSLAHTVLMFRLQKKLRIAIPEHTWRQMCKRSAS